MNTSRGQILRFAQGQVYQAQLQRLGKYRLQERVGGRGIAEVWKAFSPQLRRYVTIKILHPDLKNDPRFISRFEREAKAVASLHHPNIVQIHDFQVLPSDAIAYLVMDYIDGSTLADYIGKTSRKRNFPSAAEIVHLFASICAAMDYAHSKGIIHGDIKPANILLDGHRCFAPLSMTNQEHTHTLQGTAGEALVAEQPHWIDEFMSHHAQNFVGDPIVTDFGITRLLGTPVGTLSRWGLVTPFYLSPKQAMGYVGDASSDIYSLGVILYEICTGVPPFQGDSPSAIMMQHITTTPTSPVEVNPAISPALSKMILRSLDKNPKMRFPTASAMATTLAEVLSIPMPDIKVFTHHRDEGERATGELIGLEVPQTSRPQGTEGPRDSLPLQLREGRHSSLSSTTFWERSATRSHWSSPLTPISPDWPPLPTPPPTPAIPIAPTPSLLKLALERLGGRRQKGVLREAHLVILAVLILLLIVSSLGTLLVLAHQNPPLTVQSVGSVYFLNSGQLYMNNNQGMSDEVQIDLHGIAVPHAGKSYYAWLLGDENATEIPWLLLGKVSENHGNVHFLYTGDVAHTNLLTDMSRFVITEDDANTTPNNPLLDSSTWRYYGKIFQTPSPKDPKGQAQGTAPTSMLDHIRHLLVQAPELQALGLSGGLNIWLMRNIEEISQWALNAQAAWETKNITFMSRQLINILYYIDGECTSADFVGMPSYMPTTPENSTIARIANFSLINPCIQQQQEQARAGTMHSPYERVFRHTPPDYVDSTLFHLAGVIQSPGASPIVRTLAIELNTAVNYVKGWLVQVRKDALQLCDMSASQLTQLSTLSILSDLEVHARYAYAGESDPSTAQVQEGATWIYDNMQRLANIDVTSYLPE